MIGVPLKDLLQEDARITGISKTHVHRCEVTINQFSKFLGHEATSADLTDENYEDWSKERRAKVSPVTFSKDCQRFMRVWRTAAWQGLAPPPAPNEEQPATEETTETDDWPPALARDLPTPEADEPFPATETPATLPVMGSEPPVPFASAAEPGKLLSDAVEQYITCNQRVRSPRTVRSYREIDQHLSEFLGRPATVADLNETTVAKWFRHRETEVSRNTVNGEASTLCALWKWLALRQISGPCTVLPPERVQRAPRALSVEQLRALFDEAHTTRMMVGEIPGNVYWPALLHVLWQTAERIGAVRSLQWEDIDLQNGWVRFPAETRKRGQRELVRPINPDAVLALEALLEVSPDSPFQTEVGNVWYSLWHALTSAAGLPKWATPHTIRKSVASNLPTLDDACEMLGHSTSAVTKRNYRDPTLSDTRALLDKLPDVNGKKPSGGLLGWMKRKRA